MKNLLIASFLLLCGCASLVDGMRGDYHEYIKFYTEDNQEIDVKIKSELGTREAIIPKKISFSKSYSDLVIIIKETKCYHTSETVVSPEFNWWFLGNAVNAWFFWPLGIVGTVVDIADDSMWKYPDEVVVEIKSTGKCK